MMRVPIGFKKQHPICIARVELVNMNRCASLTTPMCDKTISGRTRQRNETSIHAGVTKGPEPSNGEIKQRMKPFHRRLTS